MQGNEGCLQPCNKWAIGIKTLMAIFKIRMHRKKRVFYMKSHRIDLIFVSLGAFFLVFFSVIFSSGLYFLWSYFLSWDFIGSSIYYFRKKVPGIKNSGLYYQFIIYIYFVLGLQKIGLLYLCFYFQVFFPETFFLVTFLHRF